MCSAKTASLIIEVLNEQVKSEKVFTAYNITEAVRSQTDESISHNDVRRIITNEFKTRCLSNYDRELCTLNRVGNPQSFVYFPIGKSASDHPLVKSDIEDNCDWDDDDIEDDVLADDEYKVTQEGRITIPRILISKVSPMGGTYDILVNGTLVCVKPNKDGRVRVSLRSLGISGNKIKITTDPDSKNIIIESS